MSDKDLSNMSEPVAWTDEEELRDVRRVGFGEMFSVEPITPDADMNRVIPLYSAEYVQSLLGRIAELELDRDVWQASALALRDTTRGEYQRGYAEAMSSAASGVRQLYIQHTHHVGVDGLLNRCKELEQSFIQSEENHRGGLTVEED